VRKDGTMSYLGRRFELPYELSGRTGTAHRVARRVRPGCDAAEVALVARQRR